METSDRLKVLLVDDEANMLSALKRVFRSEQYEVACYNNPVEALAKLDAESFDVIVSDMRMPEMSGAEFLLQAANLWPDTPRILLTGYSDHESTVRAINDAKIYRYVSKPWDNDALRDLVDEAGRLAQLSQQRQSRNQDLLKKNLALKQETHSLSQTLERNEQELQQAVAFVDLAQDELRHSYETFIKAFANIINLKIGSNAAVSQRIQEHCVMVAHALNCDDAEVEAVKIAALLYQIGKIFLHDSLLNRPFSDFSEPEIIRYRQHAVLGEQALLPVAALQPAAQLIRHQNECVDGSGLPDKLRGPAIPLGARILKVVIDFNQYLSGFLSGKDETLMSTIMYMHSESDKKYDPAVLKAYLSILDGKNAKLVFENEQFAKTSQLASGMVVARDFHNHDGILLLSKDTKLSRELVEKLKQYEKRNGLELLVPVKSTKGIVDAPANPTQH